MWIPFKGKPRYIFGHSPFLQPYSIGNVFDNFMLTLMPTISIFWRLIFCPEKLSKVFTILIMFFMEETCGKLEKRIISFAN